MNWTIGNYYKMRDGKKAVLVWIFQNGDLLFVREGDERQTRVNPDGHYYPQNDAWAPSSLDIISEWRDPLRVMVEVYRHKKGGWILSKVPDETALGPRDHWELIARREIVEGEGME